MLGLNDIENLINKDNVIRNNVYDKLENAIRLHKEVIKEYLELKNKAYHNR